jgi:hypothetical protein
VPGRGGRALKAAAANALRRSLAGRMDVVIIIIAIAIIHRKYNYLIYIYICKYSYPYFILWIITITILLDDYPPLLWSCIMIDRSIIIIVIVNVIDGASMIIYYQHQ